MAKVPTYKSAENPFPLTTKNLHDTDSYRACQKLVAEGKYDTSILIPMKWEIVFYCEDEKAAQFLVRDLTDRFENPALISTWTSNYNATWFYSYSRSAVSACSICVNLTTDEQLSFLRLAYSERDWA